MNAITNQAGWAWSGVQHPDLEAVWPTTLSLLQPCLDLDGGRYDAESLRQALEAGDMQLWLFGPHYLGAIHPKLALTTEIRVYPRQKWINIKYVGGEGLVNAADFLGTVEAWGRTQGCVGCEGDGRTGWWPLLKRSGYESRGLGYQKRFQDV
jgi:hypothetical protein